MKIASPGFPLPGFPQKASLPKHGSTKPATGENVSPTAHQTPRFGEGALSTEAQRKFAQTQLSQIKFGAEDDAEFEYPVDAAILSPDMKAMLKKAVDNRKDKNSPLSMASFLQFLLTDPEQKKPAAQHVKNRLMVPPKQLLAHLEELLKTQGKGKPSKDNFDEDFVQVFTRAQGVIKSQIDAAQAMGAPPPNLEIKLPTLLDVLFTHDELPQGIQKNLQSKLQEMTYARKSNGQVVPSVLDRFTRDVTLDYDSGDLSPVIGRDQEVLQVINIMAKSKKRNPVLTGEPGVGKTAVVEKLAEKLVKKDVPKSMIRHDGRGKFIKEIQWGKLTADMQNAQANLIALLEEAAEREDEIVLFMDELHMLNPKPENNTGTGNLANLMKPALARGAFQFIGATTVEEYKQLEKDAALERRFRQVDVQEPSVGETITILRGVRESLEEKHGVSLRDDALEVAARLGKRYITSRQMPDVAYDIVDEACAKIKNQVGGPSHDRLLAEGQLYLKEINLKKGLEKRLQEFTQDEAELKEPFVQARKALFTAFRQQIKQSPAWTVPAQEQGEIDHALLVSLSSAAESGKTPTPLVQQFRGFLETEGAQPLLESLRSASGPLKAKQFELQQVNTEIQEHQEKIEALKKELTDKKILPIVGTGDVLSVISAQSGVPLNKLSTSEKERLKNMPGRLAGRVIGQEHAIQSVCDRIIVNKQGLNDPKRPIGSFIFVGPTGVGKTELAKALAEELFDSEDALIRLDMSEYTEGHSVSKIIGSPPGYVGYEEGGQLTEKVRKRPYSVILFDEIEKAHPEVFKMMLQILDDGRLTDAQGRTVDFKNTVVIMTSNAGTKTMIKSFKEAGGKMRADGRRFLRLTENLNRTAQKALKENEELSAKFPPEFLNRIDDVLVFHFLMKDHIRKIVPILIDKKNKQNAEGEAKIKFDLSEDAIDYLAEKGTDVEKGARPVKRLIEKILVTNAARQLLDEAIHPGDTLTVTAEKLAEMEKAVRRKRKL